jgi:hypothetical protein
MKLVLLLCVAIFPAFIQAQQLTTTEKRMEVPINDGHTNERFYTFEEKGVVIRSNIEHDGVRGMEVLHHDHYNTDMELIASQETQFAIRYHYYGSYTTKNTVNYLYFSGKDPTLIYAYDVDTKEDHSYLFPPTGVGTMRTYKNFTVYGSKAVAIGVSKKGVFLFYFDLENQTSKVIPLTIKDYPPNRTIVTNLEFVEAKNAFILSTQIWLSRVEKEAYIQELSLSGELSAPLLVNAGSPVLFNTMACYPSNSNNLLITGLYTTKYDGPSIGIYLSTTEDGTEYEVSSYNFVDIPHYTDFLSKLEQRLIGIWQERLVDRGKTLINDELVYMQKLIPMGEDFISVCEFYYPTSHWETKVTYEKGKQINTRQEIFDGYQYTHALITKFNAQGQLLWSQAFEMYLWNKPMVPQTFIRAAIDGESVKLLYADRDVIYSKSISANGEILSEKSSTPIVTADKNDKMNTYDSEIVYWYKNNFLSYGFQEIQNTKDGDGKLRRRVLFMNKITFN